MRSFSQEQKFGVPVSAPTALSAATDGNSEAQAMVALPYTCGLGVN
jgi:hypothetical protein